MSSMEKFPNSQILKLFPIAALLIATPLLSSSLRSKYLYLIVNILIIAVGAEAGLLSFFFTSQQNNKPKPNAIISPQDEEAAAVSEEAMVEKSPSTPSIFFIEDGDEGEDEAGDEVGEVSGGDQELFQKAETFIGNFYKQLKMQREESWKKLHDIYHKAF